MLDKLALSPVGEFLLKSDTEPISDVLLAFLRVFSMRKTELTHWLRSDRVFDLKHIDCALETVVEENVRKFLLTRLKLLIANYPTTLKVKITLDVALFSIIFSILVSYVVIKMNYLIFLQEDLELLETTLPSLKRMAVQLRVTEKKILSSVIEYMEQWIKA